MRRRYDRRVTPAELATAVRDALGRAVSGGSLELDPALIPDAVTIERPKNRDHGDYATNVALQLAKPAGLAPRAIADALATELRTADGVAAVDIAGPGFLNITLDADAQGELARTVVLAGEN